MAIGTRIEIDLTAVEHNVGVVRRVLEAPPPPPHPPTTGGCCQSDRTGKHAGICAVVKADGYCLGAARVAKRLSMLGVEMMAVYTPNEARVLVEAAIQTPILMLLPVREIERSDALYRAAWGGRLHLSIHDKDNFSAVCDIADRLGIAVPVHLAVDTGMSRGGALPGEAGALLKGIRAHRRLRLAGVYTHLASADCSTAQTTEQHGVFREWLCAHDELIPGETIVHEANTFGALRSHGCHGDMVRIGLGLYGYGWEEFAEGDFEFESAARELKPACRWVSQVVQVKRIPEGSRVGYGGTWSAGRETLIGVVPVGYASGYPMGLANKGHVGLELRDGSRVYAPVVGRVSMDQICIDMTDVPAGEVEVDMPVEVYGADPGAPNHIPALAERAGTITHELLCRLSARIPRVYVAVEEARRSDRDALKHVDVTQR